MQKIISLFKRDYEGNRLVVPEVVPGAEWVLSGEGVPTIKWDGTCCRVKGGRLFKRFDRKLTKANAKRQRRGQRPASGWNAEHCRLAPDDWEPAQDRPDRITGHWPGWLLVGEGPEDQWHRDALMPAEDGTYELVGRKIQGNPYGLSDHALFLHGEARFAGLDLSDELTVEQSFNEINRVLSDHPKREGIVWHHPDGRMVKIKRRDFGLPWPAEKR